MPTFRIAPSILSADFARLGEEVRNVVVAGADIIHFDVMDNHYVPNLTVGPLVCQAIRPHVQVPIDVHLMVKPVDRTIPDFAKAGANIITFHPEASEHIDRSLQLIRDHGCKAGLVFNPATPLHYLDHVMDKLDIILIMSVNPGFGGQSFIPEALNKIAAVRQKIDASGRDIMLEVDGGIKVDNIAQAANAGADTFVAGSAIFGKPDYRAVIDAMRGELAGMTDKESLSHIRAAIIDLDGTMVDTGPDFEIAVNRVRGELGLAPLAAATITDFVGKGIENLVQRILSVDLSLEEVDAYFPQALAAYKHHYHAINGHHSRVYAGVREGLQAMKAGSLRLACVTNKPLEFTLPLLEKLDLARYFEVVYGGDSFPRKKPDPMAMLQVCRDFDLRPDQVVAIGDSSNDALAARNAGCRVLTVPYGYNHGQPIQEVDSDGIVSTLLEAAQLISS